MAKRNVSDFGNDNEVKRPFIQEQHRFSSRRRRGGGTVRLPVVTRFAYEVEEKSDTALVMIWNRQMTRGTFCITRTLTALTHSHLTHPDFPATGQEITNNRIDLCIVTVRGSMPEFTGVIINSKTRR